MNLKKIIRNKLPLGDQSFFQAAGGDPKICYLHGYYEFDKSEFLEITTIYLIVNIGTFNWKIIGWNL